MVYIRELIEKKKGQLLAGRSLQQVVYYYLKDKEFLSKLSFEFVGQEEMAIKGYKGMEIEEKNVENVLKQKNTQRKGVDVRNNVFKLIGIYLLAPDKLKDVLNNKFQNTSLKNKYLIYKCVPEFEAELNKILSQESSDLAQIIHFILNPSLNIELEEHIQNFLDSGTGIDVIDLIILEDLEKAKIKQEFKKTTYKSLSSIEIIRQVLDQFGNSVKKITQNRRKDHKEFKIKDEYDVQDILYVILKSLFPKLGTEDPTPKKGGSYNRIDLIARDEGILIEIKMIKESDSNEKKFVKELKEDIQSYHRCNWLDHLFCFVYDPENKTNDKQNFYDLEGQQSINGDQFNIEVILTN